MLLSNHIRNPHGTTSSGSERPDGGVEKGKTMQKISGWWFAPVNNRLPNGDNRKIKIGITHKIKGEIGTTYKIKGKIVPGEHGLYLSPQILDAIEYASGPIIYRVEGTGTIVPVGDPIDKYVCSARTYIAGGFDASEILRKFARLCALDVTRLWEAPRVVICYLQTGDESLREEASSAARKARMDAAGAAASYREMDAAKYAAKDVAWDAAWAATRNVESAAAYDSAWAAATAGAREKQNARLTDMVSFKIQHDNLSANSQLPVTG